jgi:hypothetical protein
MADETRKTDARAEETPAPEGLTPEELEAQTAEELPDREAMGLINANLAIPVNAAVAANVLSSDSTAVANAEQDADIEQSTGGGGDGGLLDANVAAPVNAAAAANVLSSDSDAIANAEQEADITQSTGEGGGLVDANAAAPVNAAVAANALSDDSLAEANAEQDATIDQEG